MRVNMGREGRASSSLSANGGAMLGSLILANGPSQPLEAATKYYVDTAFANLSANSILDGVLPISSLPAFTGDVVSSQGSNSFSLVDLGVTPGSYAKVIVDAKGRVTGNDTLSSNDIPNFDWNKVVSKPSTLDGFGITNVLSTAGGTLSGNLTVGTPTQTMSPVTKQYVDSALSNNSAVVGDIIRKPYATTPVGFLRCNGGLVDKTAYNNLYSVIGDNFGVNTIPGSGKPWEQQYNINDTQSGNITGWTANTSLPYAVLYHKCVVTKHRIYLIGGGNSGARFSAVYTAPVQSDGTIGVWAATTSLPGEFAYFQTFVTKNRLFLIGGGTNTVSTLNTIYTAPINADGTLGAWTTSGNFPVALNGGQPLVLKNRVYHFGGGVATGILDTIYSAPINTDGTLGTWTLYGTLPSPMANPLLATTKNRIYLIGGGVSGVGAGYTNTVYTTTINTDGTLGAWSIGPSTPVPLTVGCIAVTKNCVYLLGGAYAINTYTANTWRANINLDGTLSSWEYMANLPWTLGYSTCVIVKNKIHILGGYVNSAVNATVMTATINSSTQDYSPYYDPIDTINTSNYMMPGSGKPWQQQYQINQTQTDDITGWSIGTALPATFSYYATSIVTKNRVYLIGGYSTGINASIVYTAPINTDGTLGTWTTDTSLPSNSISSSCIVTKNRVYLLGGSNITNTVSTVYTSVINTDGTLGAWSTGVSLPGVLSDSQAIVTKNRVYLLGGYNGGYVSTVYTAVINTDGTLGAWSTGVSLPGLLGGSQAIVTKNRVYLLGGYNGGAWITTVYTAPIYSDGTLGAWSTGVSLPGLLGGSQAVVTKNRVYLLGGYNGTVYSSTVYTAPINTDGTLGSWTTGTSLPSGLGWATALVTKNSVYLLGGYSSASGGTGVSTVYTATISEGLNDYSAYYDGSVVPADPIDPTTFFALPDFTGKEKNGANIYIKY